MWGTGNYKTISGCSDGLLIAEALRRNGGWGKRSRQTSWRRGCMLAAPLTCWVALHMSLASLELGFCL